MFLHVNVLPCPYHQPLVLSAWSVFKLLEYGEGEITADYNKRSISITSFPFCPIPNSNAGLTFKKTRGRKREVLYKSVTAAKPDVDDFSCKPFENIQATPVSCSFIVILHPKWSLEPSRPAFFFLPDTLCMVVPPAQSSVAPSTCLAHFASRRSFS